MNEEDVDKFKEKEKLFTTYWATKQSKFVEYYSNEYSSRAGWLAILQLAML